MLFVNEHAYDVLIAAAAARYGVPAPLILAVIAHESRFDPDAIRGEPQLGDASRGLMQLLEATARGLGLAGAVEQLFQPDVNIPLGVRYLAEQYRRAGEWAAAISAYNGGYRPSLGYGKRAIVPVTVCIERSAQGQCTRTRVTPVGDFSNQDYVDAVLGYWEHYKADVPVEPAATDPPPASGGSCLGVVLGLLIAGAAAVRVWL